MRRAGVGRRPGDRPGGCPRSQLTFAEAQSRVWANKVRRGFNTSDVAEEWCLLMAELGEAVDAWRKHRAPAPGWIRQVLVRLGLRPLPPLVTDVQPVRLGVADVILFALGVAEMTRCDVGAAVEEKVAINEARAYWRLPSGAHVHDREA